MQYERWFPIEMTKGQSHAYDLGTLLCTGDENSVRVGVEIKRGKTPETVSGTIKGYVTLPNGLGLMPFNGSKSENKAWIDLPEDALGMSGRINIAIRSFDTNQTTVLLLASATIRRVDADQYYDPTDIVGDITDLIEDAEQAAQDAADALAQATQIVSYAEQTGKTDAQKAQARANIGALSEDDIEDLRELFDANVSPNGFNGNLTQGYINTAGVFTDSADYAYTDMIPVQATTFVATGSNIINGRRMTVPLRFITAYDANKAVLSAYGQQQVGNDNSYIDTDGATVVTLDQSVKYVVLSIYKPTQKYTNISVSFDTTMTDYVPYGTTVTLDEDALPDVKYATLHKFLNGKTIAVFGDSIMYGAGSDSKGAADLLAEKYGMTVAKYCVSGSTMGIRTDDPRYTVDEAHHIAKQVRNAIADEITPDIIIFNGGTNDIGGGITIGEMTKVYTQPATEAYFADGFETVAYLLRKNFVGVPMVYLRAHNMSSRTYDGQKEYGELGNQIAEKWGIRTVDMYKRMNTQLEEYRTAYLADYTHPNAAGYNKYYIPALEEFIFNEVIN